MSRPGRRITGGLSGLFLGDPGAIRQMQIVQAADYGIVIHYVPSAPGSGTVAAESAVRSLRELLAEDLPVTAVEVASIESQGGKARLVISNAPEM